MITVVAVTKVTRAVLIEIHSPLTSRRAVLGLLACAGIGTALNGRSRPGLRAFAFDAFVIFDPKTLLVRSMELVGGRAQALVTAASERLFSYTWYYTSAARYSPLDKLAVHAFREAGLSQGVELNTTECEHLADSYSHLPIWPDVPDALDRLKRAWIKLAMLSNLSERALRANLNAGQIAHYFDFVLSTDEAKKFKPAAAAYQLGMRAFQLPAAEIGFAASAAWDAAGATWFGYPTVWVNRKNLPPEQAYARPALVSSGMDGVVRLSSAEA
jgi:2-haloacid dehalogenase